MQSRMARSWARGAVGVTALLSLQSLQGAAAATSFVTLGDWGGAALVHPQYSINVHNVATQMAKTSAKLDSQFIIGTGDNFYWCGLQNTSDYQIAADWIKPFGGTSPSLLDQKWYNVLGNHEYGYDVQVQLDMPKLYDAWVLDDRYYTRRIKLGTSTTYATFIFIDTSPCISEYRSSDPSFWDPCGTTYPTCSIQDPSNHTDPFEGPCHFNANIVSQDCTKQFEWFKAALKAVPADDWLIVVGHHPADEIDVEDFTTAMQQHGFDLYLNGHAHTMTHYSVDGNPAYVTSGNGAMVLSGLGHDQQRPTSPGRERTYNKTVGLPLARFMDHQYEQIFNQKITGFTSHTFSEDYGSLTTNYLTYEGDVVHSFDVKRGTKPGPSPPPAPPSPPGPHGGCCHSNDATCQSGQVCCKASCDDPATCSYTKEGCELSSYAKRHKCFWNEKNLCLVRGGSL